MSLQTGQILKNRYRIVKILSQGGLETVYRAWDIQLQSPVTLKESFGISPDVRRQFEYEANLLRRLNHPNIVKIRDWFSISEQSFYSAIDYVEGEDLDHIADTKEVLTIEEVMTWITQICDVLSYLHSQNPPIIHRDIQPANIKITQKNQAVLVDFGLAKEYYAGVKTDPWARAVTPGFSPPEQYGAGPTDARSDIYALGATLYILLTGEIPPESVQRLENDPFPSNLAGSNLPPAIQRTIIRSMALAPAQRFASATQFKDALSLFHHSTPITSMLSPFDMRANGECPRCGSPLRSGVKFCANCGTKLFSHDSENSLDGTGNTPTNQISADDHGRFRLSVAFPKYVSKQWDSKFIVYIYASGKRASVVKGLNAEFIKEQINEILRKSDVGLNANVKVSLRSNDIVFEPEYVQKKISAITRFYFLGRPKADCIVEMNSERQVLLIISDTVTGEVYQSEYFTARVVDLVLGFIPRPLISSISSLAAGIGAITMFVLTLLGQMDISLGLVSGTAAGLLASVFYANYAFNFGARNNTPKVP